MARCESTEGRYCKARRTEPGSGPILAPGLGDGSRSAREVRGGSGAAGPGRARGRGSGTGTGTCPELTAPRLGPPVRERCFTVAERLRPYVRVSPVCRAKRTLGKRRFVPWRVGRCGHQVRRGRRREQFGHRHLSIPQGGSGGPPSPAPGFVESAPRSAPTSGHRPRGTRVARNRAEPRGPLCLHPRAGAAVAPRRRLQRPGAPSRPAAAVEPPEGTVSGCRWGLRGGSKLGITCGAMLPAL